MRHLLTLILILVAGGIGWYLGSRNATERPIEDSLNIGAEPKIQVAETIRGIGKLEPSSGIAKIFAPQGQRIESLFDLNVGQDIEPNQPLVKLSGREIREMELKIAKARKTDAKKQLAFEKSKGKLTESSAQLAVAEAISIREQVDSQRQSVKLLDSQLQIATDQLRRLQNLRTNPETSTMIGQIDLDKQQLMVEQLETQISQSQDEIKLGIEKADRAEQAARNDLETAEFAVENSAASVPFTSLNSAIEAAQTALDMTIIKSPIAGTILDIVVRPGDTATNQPVMIIGNTDEMVCIAEINDNHMRLVDVDDEVTITSVALGTDIKGHIISKGVMISPPSMKDPNPFGSVDRKTGRVVVLLDDNSAAKDFVNLQVDVEIKTDPPNQHER